MPRAAVLSLHARITGTPVDVLDDPTLAQVWGPRYSAYVIATADLPIFTLSRLPDEAKGQKRAEEMADRLEAFLQGRRMKDRDVHAALGIGNAVRYASTTGRLLIRWEGALAPTIWTVARPQMSVADARSEMARRYLHVFGPATAESFAQWAGIALKSAVATFASLADELVPVRTPVGDEWALASDEADLRADHSLPRPPGCCPAATRSSCYGAATASCSSLTSAVVSSCGRRGCGPALCWSVARSPAHGAGPPRS
jgi:hypothetical protein